MANVVTTNGSRRLDGWKAIASYLGRDVRTAQRWHEDRGMPVHRVPGGKGGVVFAQAAEIDAWLASRVPAGHAAQPDNGAAGRPAEPAAAPLEPSGAAPRRREARARRGWALGVAGILALAIGSTVAISRGRLGVRARDVSHFALRGHDLVALDAGGRALWSFPLLQTVPDASGTPQPLLPEWGVVVQRHFGTSPVVPWRDQTGATIAFVGFRKPGLEQARLTSETVYRLSPAGRLEWQYRPEATFEYRDQRFTGPWMASAWLSGGSDAGQTVAFIHHTWWPSFVVRIDDRGAGRVVYTSAGHVESLARVQRAGRRYLLAGGVNNEYRGASVAVIDESGPPAASPQTPGSPFACAECPGVRPVRYLVFPRADLNAAVGVPYNFATQLHETSSGDIEVSVTEDRERPLRSIYRLSREFVPVSVARSDAYWEAHDRLWRDGRIDHAARDCPERAGPLSVRVWEPTSGWREVSVPPTFGGRTAAVGAGR